MVSTIRNFLIGFLIEKISHFTLMYNASNKISINDVLIGKGEPTYIIAEIGINHNGDVNLAKKLVDSAVQAGANAVKPTVTQGNFATQTGNAWVASTSYVRDAAQYWDGSKKWVSNVAPTSADGIDGDFWFQYAS